MFGSPDFMAQGLACRRVVEPLRIIGTTQSTVFHNEKARCALLYPSNWRSNEGAVLHIFQLNLF
jgi:hypothetical protein